MRNPLDWLRVPRNRVRAATVLLLVALASWPITALTVFREESQGILGLSYMAIILECVVIIVTTDIRDNQSNG